MKYKKIIAVILMALLMVGCQKTPDHSAVVNNENGLKEDLIIDPLKEGEKRKTDIPATWKFSEKKSNDRVNISADLPLKNDEIGNLPIYEIKSHEMSTEELKKLTLYFADEDKLYAPSVFTKDVYQGIIDRINNNEGAYANLTLAMVYPDIRSALQQAVEIAPENEDDLKNVEIKFDQKIEDPALDKALSWSGASRGANLREKIWFEADVGEQRSSHIEAETYKNGLNNESKFIWKEGSSIASSDWLKGMLMHNNYNAEEVKKEYEPQAIEAIKSRLMLEAVIKAEKIEATEDEILEKMKEMAKNYGKSDDKEFMENENVRKYIKSGLESEKALEFLVKNAKIKK